MLPIADVIIGSIASGIVTYCVTAGTLGQRYNERLNVLEQKILHNELTIARNYLSKEDVQLIVSRLEGHMQRIEDKLDRIGDYEQQGNRGHFQRVAQSGDRYLSQQDAS